MKNLIRNTLATGLFTALLVATPGFAQPRHLHGPSEQALATIPGLTQAQRDAIYRIETEKRAEQKALWESQRAAQQAIRDQSVQELRTAIGDEAYATYAAWQLEQRAERKHERHQRWRGGAADETEGMSEPAKDG